MKRPLLPVALLYVGGILSTNFFAGQEVEITGVAGWPKIDPSRLLRHIAGGSDCGASLTITSEFAMLPKSGAN